MEGFYGYQKNITDQDSNSGNNFPFKSYTEQISCNVIWYGKHLIFGGKIDGELSYKYTKLGKK